MNLNVLFFGSCREALDCGKYSLALDTPATVANAFDQLCIEFPRLKDFGNSLMFAVNEEHCPRNFSLQEGDTLAVFPPVSGG